MASVQDYSQRAGTLDSDLQTCDDDSVNICMTSSFPATFTVPEELRLTLSSTLWPRWPWFPSVHQLSAISSLQVEIPAAAVSPLSQDAGIPLHSDLIPPLSPLKAEYRQGHSDPQCQVCALHTEQWGLNKDATKPTGSALEACVVCTSPVAVS